MENTEYIRKRDAIDMCGYYTELAYAMAGIEPVNVVPVVYGEWVDVNGNKVHLNEHGETCGTCFCNRCGDWLVASDEYAVKGYFCPNCGADMRGKEKR